MISRDGHRNQLSCYLALSWKAVSSQFIPAKHDKGLSHRLAILRKRTAVQNVEWGHYYTNRISSLEDTARLFSAGFALV